MAGRNLYSLLKFDMPKPQLAQCAVSSLPMNELAKSLTNRGLQTQVRQSMKHVPSFQLDIDLPESMLRKLEELDRAAAEPARKKA